MKVYLLIKLGWLGFSLSIYLCEYRGGRKKKKNTFPSALLGFWLSHPDDIRQINKRKTKVSNMCTSRIPEL